LEKKNSSQICHFHLVISVGRNYSPQNSLIATFTVNLCVHIQLFSVFHNTAVIGCCMWLHRSGYHTDRCGLYSVR